MGDDEFRDLAQNMWKNIQKRHSIPNNPRIHQLKSKIASLKRGNLEVVVFFSKLMGLWNKLENYAKISYMHLWGNQEDHKDDGG